MSEQCTLCPRRCGVNRRNGEIGFCGAGNRVRIARAALHRWEEPCISGENGSGAVFFSGCNMKCRYCQNHEISAGNKGYDLSVPDLADRFLMLQTQGAHNINLVTATPFVPQVKEALTIAKEKGLSLPVVYNCGGYESVETIRELDGFVDVYLPDLKYNSEKYAVDYSSAPNYFSVATAAIAEMFSQVGPPVLDEQGIMQRGMIVRHLMLPGTLFDTKKIIDYLYQTYRDDIYISLMSQYTPMPNVKNDPRLSRTLCPTHYEAMVEHCMELGLKNVFVQEMDSASETFIPEFFETDPF